MAGNPGHKIRRPIVGKRFNDGQPWAAGGGVIVGDGSARTTPKYAIRRREAAIRLNTVTTFSYAMETLIQAGNKQLAIGSVKIVTNPKTRESRLFKSSWEHVTKSGIAIFRAFIMYRPYAFFGTLGGALLVLGLIPFARFLYYVVQDQSDGHLQSLVAGTVLLIAAFIAFTLAVVADLIRINRLLIEQSLEHEKHIRFDKNQ